MSASGNGSDPRHGEISPEDREAIRRRAAEIGERLGAVKARKAPSEPSGAGLGGFIGWVLDRQLGTGPWLLVLCIMLGFAAGLLNVIRAAQRSQPRVDATHGPAPPVRDDQDE